MLQQFIEITDYSDDAGTSTETRNALSRQMNGFDAVEFLIHVADQISSIDKAPQNNDDSIEDIIGYLRFTGQDARADTLVAYHAKNKGSHRGARHSSKRKRVHPEYEWMDWINWSTPITKTKKS